ncbi:MAG: hypothetical protein CL679_10115 [Bermanella sp.]|nr:hypothetical protein [Bermanella sp.]|tara:strand:+ start:2402 stop:2644 length:243 start_codon:yes stop_codon:yes gene_type:complete
MISPEFISMLGYCGLINIGILTLWFVSNLLGGEAIINFHTRLFGSTSEKIMLVQYQLMGMYKLLNFMFFLVPWLVLTLTK